MWPPDYLCRVLLRCSRRTWQDVCSCSAAENEEIDLENKMEEKLDWTTREIGGVDTRDGALGDHKALGAEPGIFFLLLGGPTTGAEPGIYFFHY